MGVAYVMGNGVHVTADSEVLAVVVAEALLIVVVVAGAK